MQQASDERVLCLLRGANQLLLGHPEARRRNLQASSPGAGPAFFISALVSFSLLFLSLSCRRFLFPAGEQPCLV